MLRIADGACVFVYGVPAVVSVCARCALERESSRLNNVRIKIILFAAIAAPGGRHSHFIPHAHLPCSMAVSLSMNDCHIHNSWLRVCVGSDADTVAPPCACCTRHEQTERVLVNMRATHIYTFMHLSLRWRQCQPHSYGQNYTEIFHFYHIYRARERERKRNIFSSVLSLITHRMHFYSLYSVYFNGYTIKSVQKLRIIVRNKLNADEKLAE